ncbi:PASTA domain-containing protein [Paenibacillus sp. sptzw28]|uniref:penicillin-binding transpeptidase domain-containing protein n=1 Tax=Paenibacillus sp. sptzw28 TaxID=715179 RepID=UPI001C6E6C00|nr:penicillin-binding transpeptidase domain-containing protein [Paenibacillus sp. sptzw28]QYR20091.1 PASTA domain-containing protein [Paenibacillus sp. sptzw28]
MNKRIKLRTLLVGGFITLFFVVLVGRIYWVQVVKADFWSEKAREIWSKSETLIPVRGTITDREGNVLAMDVAAYTVAVNPKVIHDLHLEDVIVSKLHQVLGKPESELRAIVTAKKKNGEYYVKREVRPEGWKIDKPLRDRIEQFRKDLSEQTDKSDVGIYMDEQNKRYYPKDDMASHLIGYVDKEGNPVMGLEASLNDVLKGKEGQIVYERDGNGVILPNGTVKFNPSIDGKNVKLTIDSDIQHYVEDAIKEAYVKYKPKSITAIAVDPQTMEVLGMANMPDFNPNEYWKAQPADFYNSATKALYEPGSTFKIVTLSAAVQEGVFNPNEKYMSGSIKIPGRVTPIRDIKREGWGEISYLDGLKRSSNVAFVKLGYEKLGADRLINYIKNFGFGQKTGIELQGESSGVENINPSIANDVATASFGQGNVLVTPIQQVTAVAAVANGGKLMQPHLIKEIDDPVTKKTEVIQPKVIRQVLSEQSAKKVSEYLEQVVSDQEIGTGKNAYIEGYRVAGKTGTAQKVIDGKYSSDQYVVSFIGFAPVGNPKIAVYVVVDAPDNKYLGGGAVAAPVFRKIVLQSLRHMGVNPTLPDTVLTQQQEKTVSVPNLTELTTDQAEAQLKARSLSSVVVGTGKKVLEQIPKAISAVSPDQRVYLFTEDRSKLPIPNMSGLSMRDALEVCSLLQIRCVTEGQGFVISQTLAKQNGEKVLKLVLAPPNSAQIAEPQATAEQRINGGG